MTPVDTDELVERSKLLRGRIIRTSHEASMPHLGSCLSCIDILTALYFGVLRSNPGDPLAPDRDRFILSKGHAAPALFQVLAMRGYFPEEDLLAYGQDGGIFAEHPPAPRDLPGIEAATGSLGHGLPVGLGMALAGRIQDREYRVYALLSDGECNEGSVWEAALLSAARGVGNLCAIVDFNKWQATGRSQQVMALDPLAEKWAAFGWNTLEVDGHSYEALIDALGQVPSENGQPTAVIAHTVKGKGVSFMEDDNNWHYRIPTAPEVGQAFEELELEADS